MEGGVPKGRTLVEILLPFLRRKSAGRPEMVAIAANALAFLDGLPGARSEGAFLPLGRNTFVGASVLLG